MTRFARAFGSKSSNARVPEEATSWYVMKKQIEKNKVKHQNRKDAKNIPKLELSKRTVPKNCSKVWEKFDDFIEPDLSNCKNRTLKASGKQSVDQQIVKKINLAEEAINPVSHETTKSFKSSGSFYVVNCKETKNHKDQDEICNDKDIFSKSYNKDYETVINVPVSTCNNVQPALEKKKVTCKKRKKFYEDAESEFDVTFNSSESKPLEEFDTFNKEITNKKVKFNNSGNFKSKYDNSKPYAQNNKNTMSNEAYFQGFAVKKEDAERLHKLRKDLQAKGVPRKIVLDTLNAERRKAEKALARAKKVVCYNCRQFGHSMSDCPELEDPSGICFKCGSTEHAAKACRVVKGDSFKFSRCFICQEQGHISRQCPDNPRGLYPKGGSCKICGDVTHMRSDCPSLVSEKDKNRITVGTVDDECIEGLDQEFTKIKKNNAVKKSGVVKF